MSEHSDQQEQMERMVGLARGPKGEKGDRGEGMTRGARRAVVSLFVLVLVLATGNLVFTAREVSAVRVAEASTVQLCQSGNEARAQQVGLWQFIITISRPPPRESAAAERARLAALRSFNAYLHRVFAPRNCHALTRKGKS